MAAVVLLMILLPLAVRAYSRNSNSQKQTKTQIEAPQETFIPKPVPTPTEIPKIPYTAPVEVSDRFICPADRWSIANAKLFIYCNESGNRPNAVNGSGCIGLGQACPAGAKPALLAACPNWQTDYACQDNFFTNVYMKSRYKTWENAVAFWKKMRWW